jgi:c-di-GMP-binding flagellar brake protein YcgR
MIEKFVSPGDKLEMRSLVESVLPDGSMGAKEYKSKVHDIKNDGHIEVVMPFDHTRIVLLPIGCEYDVRFFSKGGIYRTTLKIIDRKKNDGLYILVTELTSNIHKFQRREYYRFNCIVDVKARELSDEEYDLITQGQSQKIQDAPMKKGVIVDISGGGARFLTTEIFEEEKHVLLKFNLPIMDYARPFTLTARMLYSKKIENRPGYYENRIKYEHIDNTTREEIIRYIFDEERKNRNTNKGS